MKKQFFLILASLAFYFIAPLFGMHQDGLQVTNSLIENPIINKKFYESEIEKSFKQGTFELPFSHGLISTTAFSPLHYLMMGDEVRENLKEMDQAEQVEAVIVVLNKHIDADSRCIYKFLPIGYIAWEDFKEEEQALVDGWVSHYAQLPQIDSSKIIKKLSFDENKYLSFHIIEIHEQDGSSNIIAMAHRLGRYGVEEIIWTCPSSYYLLHRHDLKKYIRAFEFKKGSRYEDHKMGDILRDPKVIWKFFLENIIIFALSCIFVLISKIFRSFRNKK